MSLVTRLVAFQLIMVNSLLDSLVWKAGVGTGILRFRGLAVEGPLLCS